MEAGATTRDGPPRAARYRRPFEPVAWMRELVAARGLVGALTLRDLQARYKHAFLGAAWALLVPLGMMAVFDVVFSRVAVVDTGGVPYPVFAYVGVLVWTFFATTVSQASQSILTNAQLLNRVYFPREVFPLASVGVAAFDAIVALPALVVLVLLTGADVSFSVTTLPAIAVLLAILLAWTTGVALIVSFLVVYVRDVRHVLPIALQLGIIVTPVAYAFATISQHASGWYALVNPLAPVIDGLRRVLLDDASPQWGLVSLAAISSTVVLVAGYLAFKHMETGLADIA